MAEDTNNPNASSDDEAQEKMANVPDPAQAQTLNLSVEAEKAEHIPPIIIRGGSFIIEHAHRLTPVTLPAPLPAPFSLTFLYNDPLAAFHMRGIRFVKDTFGYPETLYYNPNPRGCVVDITTSNPARRFRLFTTLISDSERLILATGHELPEEIYDDTHPHRKYSRRLEGTVQVDQLTVIDSATSDTLYKVSHTATFPIKNFHLGVLRGH